MQKLLGMMRKAVMDYDMISPGDRIAVGVSGGKDSLALLEGLCRMRSFLGIPYTVCAVTVDPTFFGEAGDFSAVAQLCRSHDVEYVVRSSDLWEIIFEQRKESNPCSLCARMRRGMLHDMAKELGCNKLALGHNRDDAVETFMMNLFHEGRIGCFQPVTYLSRKDLTMIRPLIFADEREIRNAAARCALPIVKSNCPVDGKTARENTKQWMAQMEKTTYPGLSNRIFGAIQRGNISGF